MHNESLSARLHNILDQRCRLLLLALVALLLAMPVLSETPRGQAILVLLNILVLLTAVAVVGRTWVSLVLAAIMVVPALFFRFQELKSGQYEHLAFILGSNAVFHVFVIVNLLRHVFRPDLMSRDKLYGAVAVYILIAIFWSYLHGLIQHFYPGAYSFAGTPQALRVDELIYFSFTALTTAGFGDIAPVVIQSRYLTILEMVVGVMFVAITIARLTSVYPVAGNKS